MASYYDYFCQTNTRAAITTLSAIATVAYIGLTLWSFNQWSQNDENFTQSCGPQNKTTTALNGRGLFGRSGGGYVKQKTCDEVYTGECINLCETAGSSLGQAFLLLELGVFGLLGSMGLCKAKQMVTKAIELPAFDNTVKVGIFDQDVEDYGATQQGETDSDDELFELTV